MAASDIPELAFATAEDLDAWLGEHHAAHDAVWLRIAKKGSGIPSPSWAELVPVLLRWGWIDGQKRGIDEQWYALRVGPRRARSVWSKVNVAHAERLIAEGRMQAPGLQQVELARADGRWEAAYAPASRMEVPPELRAALDASPRAAAAFEALTRGERYSMCWRIHNAKREETKLRNAARYVAELEARA